MNDRFTVELMGVAIGTATAWDGDPGEEVIWYNFECNSLFPELGNRTLSINETKGVARWYDDKGDTIKIIRILPLLVRHELSNILSELCK